MKFHISMFSYGSNTKKNEIYVFSQKKFKKLNSVLYIKQPNIFCVWFKKNNFNNYMCQQLKIFVPMSRSSSTLQIQQVRFTRLANLHGDRRGLGKKMISKGARDSIHLLGRRHQAFQDDAIRYDLNHTFIGTTYIYRIISILSPEKNKSRSL